MRTHDAITGILLGCALTGAAYAADYTVASPGGNIVATVSFNEGAGTFSYQAQSNGAVIVSGGPLGLVTSQGDFTSGLAFVSKDLRQVDETYTLPVGKRSTYVNRAGELELVFTKNQKEFHFLMRAYDEGIAFRYAVPGADSIQISSESTTFNLASANLNFWGMTHPNNYGYETELGPINGTNAISMPAMSELVDKKYFVFVAQAATYEAYIIPWFQRQGSTLKLMFPLDQKTPIKTVMPFATPWRVAILSPDNPAKMVESSLLENLNPPTEPDLVGADWIKPGRASWDFIAGGGDNLRAWIDFDASMGWNYHVADAGWETRVPDMAAVTQYGKQKGVGIIVWGKVANKTYLNSPANAEAWMTKLEGLGISGAKIDFFDQQDSTVAKTDDLEDTQERLWVRDFLSTTAIKHHLVVEFHGCAVPSGERRHWPNLMSAEAVSGMEHKHTTPIHELTIPYVRNLMGAVSYTPVNFGKSDGSYGFQLGQTVVYETGIQIFSDSPAHYAGFAGLPFMKIVPSTWDEPRFIDGYPASHVVIARRKGADWYIGGFTGAARTAQIPLAFLRDGATYQADLYRDGATKTDLVVEHKTYTNKDVLSIPMLAAGGFAMVLKDTNPPIGVLQPLVHRRIGASAFTALGGAALLPKGWLGGDKTISVFDMQGRLLFSSESSAPPARGLGSEVDIYKSPANSSASK